MTIKEIAARFDQAETENSLYYLCCEMADKQSTVAGEVSTTIEIALRWETDQKTDSVY